MGTFLSALVFPLLVPRVVLRMPVSRVVLSVDTCRLTRETQVLMLVQVLDAFLRIPGCYGKSQRRLMVNMRMRKNSFLRGHSKNKKENKYASLFKKMKK